MFHFVHTFEWWEKASKNIRTIWKANAFFSFYSLKKNNRTIHWYVERDEKNNRIHGITTLPLFTPNYHLMVIVLPRVCFLFLCVNDGSKRWDMVQFTCFVSRRVIFSVMAKNFFVSRSFFLILIRDVWLLSVYIP